MKKDDYTKMQSSRSPIFTEETIREYKSKIFIIKQDKE